MNFIAFQTTHEINSIKTLSIQFVGFDDVVRLFFRSSHSMFQRTTEFGFEDYPPIHATLKNSSKKKKSFVWVWTRRV